MVFPIHRPSILAHLETTSRCGLLHIPSHIIPLKDDFTLDPKDYYGLHQTIVIANPNAPTGLLKSSMIFR